MQHASAILHIVDHTIDFDEAYLYSRLSATPRISETLLLTIRRDLTSCTVKKQMEPR